MMNHIEVIIQADNLHQESWKFTYLDNRHTLALTSYTKSERPSPRHKFRSIIYWDAYKSGNYGNATIEAIPLPDSVKSKAAQKFLLDLKITKGLGGVDK